MAATANFPGIKVSSALILGLSCLAFSKADISYNVQFQSMEVGGRLHVTVKAMSKDGTMTLQMPFWAPGAYVDGDYGKAVEGFQAVDGKGAAGAVTHPDSSTWIIKGAPGDFTATYDLPISIAHGVVHYQGPRTYMYVVGRKQEKCDLTIDLQPGWKIATGLDPVGSVGGKFTAPTYDVLADSAVTMGTFVKDEYTSHGKPHYIALYGDAVDKVDQQKLIEACKFVSDSEGNFFGEVPYKRYVWHFSVYNAPDGGGGLEHLNGTEISLASGLGPGTVSVLAHEFFHLWNVKRIRAKVLGPFDYTKLPQTGALWWLEGVTDYYAGTLPYRYGWWDSIQLFKEVAKNIGSVESNPNRTKISPYDSSYRVDEAAGGRGNSQGLLVSYYDTGWLLGLMLNTEILVHSNGKYSLDNVELALWNLCKNNKPGFEEDEIRKLCVRFGGPDLGVDYDNWVMRPGDLPVEVEIAKLGLKLKRTSHEESELPFELGFSQSRGVLTVGDPKSSGLQKGDVIKSIDGVDLTTGRMSFLASRRELMSKKAGDKVPITIERDGADLNTKITLDGRTIQDVEVYEDPDATAAQLALRKLWMSPRPGTQAVLPVKP